MINFKNLCTVVSVISALAIFIPYFIGLKKKEVKPHIFSWLTWGVLTGTGFLFSFSNGGAGGSFILGIQSVLCLVVAFFAIQRGEKNITKIDWMVLAAIIIAFLIYLFTKNSVLSVILAASIDSLGYVPTFRKSYLKPHDEALLTYFFSFLGFLFSLGALGSYSIITMFYPIALLLTNGSFIIFLFIRRTKIFKPSGA